MAAAALASPDDVADLWRPLTSDEEDRVLNLIDKTSAMLRQRAPWVDARLALYAADPTNPAGLAPVTVATVVATAIKRFLSNTQGIAAEGVGPYHVSYALRNDKAIRGELHIIDDDIAKLAVPASALSRLGSVKVKAKLAPWPYGNLTPDQTDQSAASALDVFIPGGGTDGNWYDAAGA